MADVAVAFLGVAVLTFIGFGAGRIFERTRFPDAPILLLVGLILGAGNRWAVGQGWGSTSLADALAPEALRPAAPFMAALALVVILFDSGLQLQFRAVQRSFGAALAHTIPIFVLTVAGVALAANLLFGMPWIVGVVLGVTLASVDQTVSSGMVRHLRVPEHVRAVSVVEMALYDMVSVPILVSLFAFAGGAGADWGPVARDFATLAAVSIFLGTILGLLWAYALHWLRGHPNSYMLTFAMVLATYGCGETLGGSGAIAILLFGLVVGNRQAAMQWLTGRPRQDLEGQKVQAFHDEITFFVRTLFFLFVGVSFSVDPTLAIPTRAAAFGPLGRGIGLVALGAATLTAVLIGARWLGIAATARGPGRERRALFPVFGRGLDTAVLASLPFVATRYVEGTAFHALFSPWEATFVNLALLVILATVLASSLLTFLQERRPPTLTQVLEDPAPQKPGPKSPAAPAAAASEGPATVAQEAAPRPSAAARAKGVPAAPEGAQDPRRPRPPPKTP